MTLLKRDYGYLLKHLAEKVDYLAKQQAQDPEDAAYDDGYASALEYAIVAIEESLGGHIE